MRMRKGFTLIELLIVIIIIGILATAMLLSSGNATAAAKAATVISDLRSMKSAALLFYVASYDQLKSNTEIKLEQLLPFMDDAVKFTKSRKGGFGKRGNFWYVGVVSNGKDVNKVLESKAESAGLYSDPGCTTPFKGKDGSQWVYMKARNAQ